MATDHRGNNVGNPTTSHGGHRPTPRLAQLILKRRNMDGQDGTVQSVQNDLNDYRDYRGMHNVPEYEQMIDEDQEYLNDIIKTRHQGQD